MILAIAWPHDPGDSTKLPRDRGPITLAIGWPHDPGELPVFWPHEGGD